jgi:hypothetical protein
VTFTTLSEAQAAMEHLHGQPPHRLIVAYRMGNEERQTRRKLLEQQNDLRVKITNLKDEAFQIRSMSSGRGQGLSV